MTNKLTYEELKQKVKELERKALDSKQIEETLRGSEQRFRDLVESTSDWVWEVDREGVYTYSSPKIKELLGYEPEEVIGKTPFDFMPSEEAKRVFDFFYNFVSSQEPFDSLENTNLHKNGHSVVMETSGAPFFNAEGEILGYRGIDRDITERKQVEEALKKERDRSQQTAEALKLREKQLEDQTQHLEEVNTAMKVLLKKRDEDKIELEQKVLVNVKELVFNYLEKLKKSGLESRQQTYVDIMESNLQDIVSPFLWRLSSQYNNLTSSEVQVAELIRQGKTSKEISELFNLSSRTIEFHRDNIREKMGIKNRKTNLRTHLLSIQSA